MRMSSCRHRLLGAFGGPRIGHFGSAASGSAGRHPLTCAAIKPQGLPPAALADLTFRFGLGRIDFIKDDHALADQAYRALP